MPQEENDNFRARASAYLRTSAAEADDTFERGGDWKRVACRDHIYGLDNSVIVTTGEGLSAWIDTSYPAPGGLSEGRKGDEKLYPDDVPLMTFMETKDRRTCRRPHAPEGIMQRRRVRRVHFSELLRVQHAR